MSVSQETKYTLHERVMQKMHINFVMIIVRELSKMDPIYFLHFFYFTDIKNSFDTVF